MVVCPRDERGRLLPLDALARFAAKCAFDPATGCVNWTGGTSAGRGNSTLYGVFKYEGDKWYAHRWAAVHIHGIDLGKDEAGHGCANSLCVQHLAATTKRDNVLEMHERRAAAKAEQSGVTRQYWLLGFRGYEPPPERAAIDDSGAIPFHEAPAWLRPFMAEAADDCPF